MRPFTFLQSRRRRRRFGRGRRRRGCHGNGDLLRGVEERQADGVRREPALRRTPVRGRVAEQQAPRLRLHRVSRRHERGREVQTEHPGERQKEEPDPAPGQQDQREGGPSRGRSAESSRHRPAEGGDRSVQVVASWRLVVESLMCLSILSISLDEAKGLVCAGWLAKFGAHVIIEISPCPN